MWGVYKFWLSTKHGLSKKSNFIFSSVDSPGQLLEGFTWACHRKSRSNFIFIRLSRVFFTLSALQCLELQISSGSIAPLVVTWTPAMHGLFLILVRTIDVNSCRWSPLNNPSLFWSRDTRSAAPEHAATGLGSSPASHSPSTFLLESSFHWPLPAASTRQRRRQSPSRTFFSARQQSARRPLHLLFRLVTEVRILPCAIGSSLAIWTLVLWVKFVKQAVHILIMELTA